MRTTDNSARHAEYQGGDEAMGRNMVSRWEEQEAAVTLGLRLHDASWRAEKPEAIAEACAQTKGLFP